MNEIQWEVGRENLHLPINTHMESQLDSQTWEEEKLNFLSGFLSLKKSCSLQPLRWWWW